MVTSSVYDLDLSQASSLASVSLTLLGMEDVWNRMQ